jgi:hypothetical protein
VAAGEYSAVLKKGGVEYTQSVVIR